MAKTVSGRKQKARLLQQEVVAAIREVFPELTERDVKSAPMGTIGEDVVLSQAAIGLFPYAVECKAQESLSIWAALKQAESRANHTAIRPLLVFRRNRTEAYVAMQLKDFMTLVKK